MVSLWWKKQLIESPKGRLGLFVSVVAEQVGVRGHVCSELRAASDQVGLWTMTRGWGRELAKTGSREREGSASRAKGSLGYTDQSRRGWSQMFWRYGFVVSMTCEGHAREKKMHT